MKNTLLKHLHVIIFGLGLLYLVGFFFNKDYDWLSTSVLMFGVGLFLFIKKPFKDRSDRKTIKAKDISCSYESFNLRGINYDNRQENMHLVEVGIELTPRFYKFEGDPAIEFLINGKSIGFAPHELAPSYYNSDFKFIINRTYVMGDGKKGAEVLVKRK